jgi:hypothetical protein
MDYTIVLTLEYLFDQDECVIYLELINIDPEKYNYVHSEHYIDEVQGEMRICQKKQVRKLRNVMDIDLTEYTNLMQVIFDRKFDSIITFPNHVVHITFGTFFDKPITLHHNIIYLKFGSCFSQKILYLPRNLKYLSTGFRFNRRLPKLPRTLIHLKLGFYFNHVISYIPDSLRVLKVANSFNKKLPQLPCNLTKLVIGYEYNHKLSLPTNITQLEWNSKMKLTSLPPKLTHFTFCEPRCMKYIPSSIIYLDMCYVFSDNVIKIPMNLKYLLVHIFSMQIPINNKQLHKFYEQFRLPASLKYLKWDCYYEDNETQIHVPELPAELKKLEISYEYLDNYELPELPIGLIHLNIMDNFNHKLSSFPVSLTYLSFGDEYNYKLPQLPTSLTYLDLGNNYNHEFHVPLNLEYLILGTKFNYKLELPNTLVYLVIGDDYAHNLVLPDSLRELKWNSEYILPLLPNKLNMLLLGRKFNHHVNTICFIREIMVYRCYVWLHELQQIYGNRLYYLD